MSRTDNLFLLFLILSLCFMSIVLGYEIARDSSSIKSEIIQKYKSGEIVCAEVGAELVCRSAK